MQHIFSIFTAAAVLFFKIVLHCFLNGCFIVFYCFYNTYVNRPHPFQTHRRCRTHFNGGPCIQGEPFIGTLMQKRVPINEHGLGPLIDLM